MKICTKCGEAKPVKKFHWRIRKLNKREPHCKECRKQHHQKNKEAINYKRKLQREKNKELFLSGRRNYYQANQEKMQAKSRDDYKRNKKKRIESKKVWRDNNKYKIRANYEATKDKLLQRNQKRRALKKNVSVGIVPSDIEIYHSQNGLCANCKIKIKLGGSPRQWHIDHIIPLSKGGEHVSHNLQMLCASCNSRKHAKMPEEWAMENGRLL